MKRKRPEPLFRVGEYVRLSRDKAPDEDLIVLCATWGHAKGMWIYDLVGQNGNRLLSVFYENSLEPAGFSGAPADIPSWKTRSQ